MKQITLFLLLASLMLTASCGKNDDLHTTISGRILEHDTNMPISGATVVAYGGVSNGDLSNPGAILETIDSDITDAEGRYNFDFDASAYTLLDMSVSHNQYFPLTTLIQNIFRGKDNEVDIILDPHAWLELHVKNVMPVNQFDIISVGNSFINDDVDPIFGNMTDTTLVGLVKGNSNQTRAIWFVTKNSVTENYNEIIYCPAHDTTTFEIFY